MRSEVQVAPPGLENWRRVSLEAEVNGLKRRSGYLLERELERTRAKVGEPTMRLEFPL
ncbi:MAG: hypothetical protein V3U58_08310 [Thermodesulfobacteriota bacterium]